MHGSLRWRLIRTLLSEQPWWPLILARLLYAPVYRLCLTMYATYLVGGRGVVALTRGRAVVAVKLAGDNQCLVTCCR